MIALLFAAAYVVGAIYAPRAQLVIAIITLIALGAVVWLLNRAGL